MSYTDWSSARPVGRLGRSLAGCCAVAAGVGIAGIATPVAAGAARPTPAGGVSVPYSCSASIGTVKAPINVAGKTPASVAPKASVKMTGYQVTVTIPASEVNRVIGLTHATSASGKITKLDVKSTDAKPAVVNVAAKPIAFGPLKLVKNKPLVIMMPVAAATIGSWVAQTKGTMTFTSSTIALTIAVGHFTVPATCKPTKAVAVSTTSVT